jgi:putative phosphoesterase
MRIVVLSDTHMSAVSSRGHSTGGRGFPRALPEAVHAALRRAEVILHAGDVVAQALLDQLATYAPVHAVLGNNDHALTRVLPESVEVELDGVRLAMVHDSGPTKGRPARLHRRFPDAQVVVYGHSHMPDDSIGVDGQRLFNPGSPTERRRAPHRTFGLLDVRDGHVRRHQIVAVD